MADTGSCVLTAFAFFLRVVLLVSGCSLAAMGQVGLPSGVVLDGRGFVYDGVRHALDSHNFLVDGSYCGQGVCDFVFASFGEACEALSDGTQDSPMTIFIAPGVYWIDDPEDTTVAVGMGGREPFGMIVRCQYLHLRGLSANPTHVVLASQRGQTQGAIGNFTMFDFYGDGLQVHDLTMGNFCNVDLDYPLDPSKSRKRRSSAITQAHVAYCHGDRVVARNVRFISRLNMNPLNGARRILYDHCHMECTDDALTGNGVYLHCDFDFYGQKPFYTTHPSGAVLIDCDFRLMGHDKTAYFCKADGPVTLIDCRIHAPQGTEMRWAPYPHPWTRCYQGGVTFNGNAYVISPHSGNTVLIDGTPLRAQYGTGGTYSVAPLLAGDDGWDPLGEGNASPHANSLLLSPSSSGIITGDQPLVLNATFMRHDGKQDTPADQSLSWRVLGPDSVLRLQPLPGGRCLVHCQYDGDEPVSCVITATSPYGMVGAAQVVASPARLSPPVLVGKPSLAVDGCYARLSYTADMQGKRDVSVIDWYRSPSASGKGAILVSDGRKAPHDTYKLSQADAGWYLMAVIIPQSVRSAPGKPDTVVSAHKVTRRMVPGQNELHTDFSDFACAWQPDVLPGFWTVDGYKPDDTEEFEWDFDRQRPMWTYGEGYNGAVGHGLMQAQRGARLMYTPLRGHKGDMSLALLVDPAKTAGQGFGSATGQYMDVCLKFDTRTLTGYGLRIIRTVKYANAVDFMLVKYDHGSVSTLTAPVSAVCYRTGCKINLRYSDGLLSASVTTSTPLAVPDDPQLATQVNLTAHVSDNGFAGIHIQHTGSCGESVTMLHQLDAKWR